MAETTQDLSFMDEAMALALQAQAIGEIPVGAVVVHNGEIVGRGYNQSITLNDPSAHAEMLAIREAGKTLGNYRLLDCTLYVTLEPCPMCAGLLVHSRIKRLVYGAKDEKTGSAGSIMDLTNHVALNHKIEAQQSSRAEQCSAMLSAFLNNAERD